MAFLPRLMLSGAAVLLGCGAGSPPTPAAPAPPTPATLTFEAIALPGASAPASLDYMAYEPAQARVWVPVGNTGSVDVFDISAGTFTVVDGFRTAERESHGKTRTTGPSAVAIGDGFAFVGNRATSEVCAVDTTTLKTGTCLTLPSPTDGVAYVAPVREVWVTMPRSRSIAVVDASTPSALKLKTTVQVDGAPEGYASDESRGLFFTNLEDANKTSVIDVASHRVKATWNLDCGTDGPRGIAADVARGFVYVACTDHVLVLDGLRDGAKLASIATGGGVDNIDWLEPRRLLYAASGKAATVTVAHIDDEGRPTVVATGTSSEGARNGVADASGNVYVADPARARLLVFAHPR